MKTFSKATASALAATVVDFGSLTLFVEVFHGFYPYGVALGAFLGALTNFMINRHWAFEAHDKPLPGQMLRYAIVSSGSLLLNTFGVYMVTEKFGLFYLASKIVVALLVGFLFNYPLQRYFVYPPERRNLATRVPM
jgi:putative flippase GtrA